jgi:hypothetical protein
MWASGLTGKHVPIFDVTLLGQKGSRPLISR